MPNLPMHIYLANRLAQELDWGEVHDNLEDYLLGSTAPDIRAMTKWDRERTHFAPLSLEQIGTGTKRMFQLHPQLAEKSKLKACDRAFLIGYISHLTADEVWITTMYRPNFNETTNVAGSELEGHIWDRAIQLDMDRAVLERPSSLENVSSIIADGDPMVELEFLEAKLLVEWRQWVGGFLSREFSWERLKRALNRMYRDDDDVQQLVENFLVNIESRLEEIYDKIPRVTIQTYHDRVSKETIKQIKEYLSET
jgi:hypothetical protein